MRTDPKPFLLSLSIFAPYFFLSVVAPHFSLSLLLMVSHSKATMDDWLQTTDYPAHGDVHSDLHEPGVKS
jgi:hypothetical protein